MKTIPAGLLTLLALPLLLLPMASWASDDDPLKCTSLSPRITSIAFTDGHTTPYDSQGAGGAPEGFDPVPLGITTINIPGGTTSCLVAELSVHSLTAFGIGDQLAVYQVRVDGNPMIGHTTWCSTSGGVNFPCLTMDNSSPVGIASHAYRLYYAGCSRQYRTIDVRFAGCCRGLGAYTGGILTLHHR